MPLNKTVNIRQLLKVTVNRNKSSLLNLILVMGRFTVAARSKAWVCGRWLAGIAGSNPAGGMDVCLL